MSTDNKEDKFTIDRRQFFSSTGAGAVGVIVLPEVFAADSTMPSAVQQTERVRTSSAATVLANERVAFTFDPKSKALKQILHKTLKRTLEVPKSAAAPVRIWLGTSSQPDQTGAVISQNTQDLTAQRSFEYPGGVGAEFTWLDLKDVDGHETGVYIHQFCTLDDGSEFLRLRTRVVNRGDFLITGLLLGLPDLAFGAAAEAETLTAPTGSMGKMWANPRVSLATTPQIFSIPPTAPGSLVCGWLDLSAPGFGFGVGYLNRRGMDMVGEARFDDGRAALGWRLFRYQGSWAFMEKINGPLQIYPLQRGEEFSSDDWFLGFHQGDWHETASFYRKEYERTFAGDFLDWERTSPAVRNADLIINTTAAWGVMAADKKKYDLTKGEVRSRFLDIPGKVKKMVEAVGVRPANSLVVMLGQATHWGIYKLPDYFPVSKEAGGPADFKEMIRQLRQDIGIAGTHFYAHATFNHQQAENYVAEADTGWDANLYSNYDHLGRIACMDSKGWWELWKNKIIPGFVESGASGIEFDEGFGHHFICSQPGHLHSSSAESILTAQLRGSLRIFRECRRAFGSEGYLESEGGSDVGARHFDLWEAGGKAPLEVVRYTHPDKMIALFANDAEDFNRAFIYGLVVLYHVDRFTSEVAGALGKYAALRRQLREQRAPGYPHGFRDDRGLKLSTPGVLAKVFSDSRGITVAAYAKEPARAELAVDGRLLGHPKIGVRRQVLKLAKQQAGYFIIE